MGEGASTLVEFPLGVEVDDVGVTGSGSNTIDCIRCCASRAILEPIFTIASAHKASQSLKTHTHELVVCARIECGGYVHARTCTRTLSSGANVQMNAASTCTRTHTQMHTQMRTNTHTHTYLYAYNMKITCT